MAIWPVYIVAYNPTHLTFSVAVDDSGMILAPRQAILQAEYRGEVRSDILKEEDGPMLLHGLKGLHGEKIFRPHNAAQRPDLAALAARYERFRQATAR